MITIIGRNPVLESLRSGQTISDIYIKEGVKFDDKINEILDLAKSSHIRFKFVSKRFLDNISENAVHQGVAAIKVEKVQRRMQAILEEFDIKRIIPKIIYIRGKTRAAARTAGMLMRIK